MWSRSGLTAIFGCCFALVLARGTSAQVHDEARPGIEATVRQITLELSAVCPLADPADQNALEACRGALFTGSLLRRSVDTVLLWGRPHAKPGEKLKNTTLTQFAPEVWTGLYAPLFMFDGTWRLDYDEGEGLYRRMHVVPDSLNRSAGAGQGPGRRRRRRRRRGGGGEPGAEGGEGGGGAGGDGAGGDGAGGDGAGGEDRNTQEPAV